MHRLRNLRMASPRPLASAIRRVSPLPTRYTRNQRQQASPKTPIGNDLRVNDVDAARSLDRRRLSPFNIDTPNRAKILKDGLPDRQHTILGCGGFGVVVKASYKGDQVAAKIVRPRRGSDVAVKAEEHATFLRHANIVKVLRVEQGTAFSLITMELCGTSLQDRLEEAPLARMERVNIWRAIACALRFCHHAGVVHADVKPRNVLMAADGQPKLADFGSSVLVGESQLHPVSRGTPGYAAPEVIRGELPSPAADVYSLGVLAWQMLSRKTPFSGLHPHTILYMMGKGASPLLEVKDDEFNGLYKELYRKSCSAFTEERPSIDTVINQLGNLK